MERSPTAGHHPARARLLHGALVLAALAAAYLAGRSDGRPAPAERDVPPAGDPSEAAPARGPARLAGARAMESEAAAPVEVPLVRRGTHRPVPGDGGVIAVDDVPEALRRLAADESAAGRRALLDAFARGEHVAGHEAFWARVLATIDDPALEVVLEDRLREAARDGPWSTANAEGLWRLLLGLKGERAGALAVEVLDDWGLPAASALRSTVIQALGGVPRAFADPAVADAVRRAMDAAPAVVWAAGRAMLDAGDVHALRQLEDWLVTAPDTGTAAALKPSFARALGAKQGAAALPPLRAHAEQGEPLAVAAYVSALAGATEDLDADHRREAAEDLAILLERVLPSLLLAVPAPDLTPGPAVDTFHARGCLAADLADVAGLLATRQLRDLLAEAVATHPRNPKFGEALRVVEAALAKRPSPGAAR